MWGDSLANKRILFFTDNDSVVHVINQQTSKNKELLYLLRQLVLTCLQHNILFRARHIQGKKTILADSLPPFTGGAVPNIGPRCRGESNRCAATPPSAELGEILSSLLRGSISTSSLYTYQRPWLIFKQFLSEQLRNSNLSLPVSVHDLALFIAYLAKSKYSASTVFTYISSIGYVHRLGSFPDLTQSPQSNLP